MYFNKTPSLAALILVIAFTADALNNFKILDLFLNQHAHPDPLNRGTDTKIECTFCKYSVTYLCNTYFGNGTLTSDIFWFNVSTAIEQTCEKVIPQLGLSPDTCEGVVFFIMPAITGAFENTIAPNVCNFLDSQCKAGIPSIC